MADSSEPRPAAASTGGASLPQLIHDWNTEGRPGAAPRPVALFDQTLRDGLQAPSAHDPSPEQKRRLLHLMAALEIQAADIGLPAAGSRMLAQVRDLAGEIVRHRLPIQASCAARTLVGDIEPVARISQATGCPIEVATFVGSSDLRHYIEAWPLDQLLGSVGHAVSYAVREGLAVMFVAEDASRARPAVLKALCLAALEAGASRICLADTAGHATPAGVASLIGFVRREITATAGRPIGIDWHGHRDRGLAMANCLAAIDAGADRIHATALGLGERAGNAEMELLLVNLKLVGRRTADLSLLPEYCDLASAATGVPVPANAPVIGADVFRTGSGTHAAAIQKAAQKAERGLADLVYSSVPAAELGLEQRIAVSSYSGLSNVRHWLARHGYDCEDPRLLNALLEAAKQSDRALSDDECQAIVLAAGAPTATGVADAGN